MRLSTYNIWSSDRGMPDRFFQILEEIKNNKADIICLQEVVNKDTCKRIGETGAFKYFHYYKRNYIAILSKFPILQTNTFEFTNSIIIEIGGKKLLIINTHLPWKSALQREKEIVSVIEKTRNINTDYTILSGDFNCSENSSVHRYLKGDQSLLNSDAYFVDLAEAYAEIEGHISSTLNVRENPRYRNTEGIPINTIEINQRYDRILLKNPFPMDYPTLKSCGIFGTTISPITNLCASDHYGLYVDLEFD